MTNLTYYLRDSQNGLSIVCGGCGNIVPVLDIIYLRPAIRAGYEKEIPPEYACCANCAEKIKAKYPDN